MGHPQPASVRDRTPEFLMLCERLQKQLGPSTSAATQGNQQKATPGQQIPNQHSEFARRAAEIGHGIHKTSLKLQKLTQLAKRTSMFDDPALEVDELTGLIKQDIEQLNRSVNQLQSISKGSKEDSKQSHDHSHTVVDSLRTRLKDATQTFREVLTVRSDNLSHQKERRQLFSNPDTDASMPLLRPKQQQHQPDLENGNSSSTSQPLFMQMQDQLQPQAQDSYREGRELALRNVESTIAELGTIFTKLSEMVAQQGELAIRIDQNVEDALENVTSAQGQLLKYLNTISSNRWLVMKIFFVLIIFIVFFLMFVA